MKTHQETFDIVVRALIAQRRPSVDKFGDCQYRGHDGAKCAAGHLIPDEKYDAEMEGAWCNRINDPISRRIADVLRSEGHDPHFVAQLQDAHDYAADLCDGDFVAVFKERAQDVADRFDLNADALGAIAP